MTPISIAVCWNLRMERESIGHHFKEDLSNVDSVATSNRSSLRFGTVSSKFQSWRFVCINPKRFFLLSFLFFYFFHFLFLPFYYFSLLFLFLLFFFKPLFAFYANFLMFFCFCLVTMTWKGSWTSFVESAGNQIGPLLQGGSLQRASTTNLHTREPPHSIGSWIYPHIWCPNPSYSSKPWILECQRLPNLYFKDLFIFIQKRSFFFLFFLLFLIFFLISCFCSFDSFWLLFDLYANLHF